MIFFDVDHTITRHPTGRRFVEAGYRMKQFPLRLLLHMPAFYLRYRLGFLTQADLSKEVGAIRGRTRFQLQAIAEEAVAYSMKHDLFVQALDTVHRLQSEGHETAIATSSLDILVRPLAERLGMQAVIATELEFDHEVATGRAAGAPCIGLEKRRRVLELIESRGLAPAECGFYTDSINDLPVLEALGTAVVVNPDPRLRRVARARGWRIERFNR